MSEIINIYEAKTNLSKLVERAAAGADIVIARAGQPMVRLVAVSRSELRKPGLLAHLHIPEAFYDPLPPEEREGWE